MPRKITNIHHLVGNFSPFSRNEIFQKFFFTGNNLFNVCMKCPKFGIGRIATRQRWTLLYPNEPSYFQITRVKIDPSRKDLDGGKIWGVKTWRGYRIEEEKLITSAFKKEWILIRKSDEKEFCEFQSDPLRDFAVVPSHRPLPPLLKAMVLQQYDNRNIDTDEEPMLKLVVEKGPETRLLQPEDVERLKQTTS
ncbi:small ribosomal subunit protein mS34-like [Saccoglossus kowalevskii]|uniref:28S ribosomal protein S34, mitochondrial-like n=1 Tax=Saccoglossus kowalevskii TaxID=10224 RepID=A0ABM0GQT4_SACKO|nr:PREDICTED: 28S ribosomal protein S34, mitochondrial-like [Saccoglossus kowalevskii]